MLVVIFDRQLLKSWDWSTPLALRHLLFAISAIVGCHSAAAAVIESSLMKDGGIAMTGFVSAFVPRAGSIAVLLMINSVTLLLVANEALGTCENWRDVSSMMLLIVRCSFTTREPAC
jgi:hypothetical protein